MSRSDDSQPSTSSMELPADSATVITETSRQSDRPLSQESSSTLPNHNPCLTVDFGASTGGHPALEQLFTAKQAGVASPTDDELQAIFRIVKDRSGHDFSSYKRNTVIRRIERRMMVNDVAEINKYIALLESNEHEAIALGQEILIGVTRFFRDREAFTLLQDEIIPRLFADRDPDEPVRIWHACCATGEEVYSTAILIREYLNRHRSDARVQLFATDLDEVAIDQARAGHYGEEIAADVGEERLKAFFTRRDGRWQIAKHLREMVVFAHHNLIRDPPFSRLDLLVCRNFLIYLNPEMQKRLFSLFHMVLKPKGILFLGASETVGRHSDLFVSIDKKWKVFERVESGHQNEPTFPFNTRIRKLPGAMRQALADTDMEPDVAALAQGLLVERYAPPCVVVNDRYEVIRILTRAGRFLEAPLGKPTSDILKMAREELRPALRAAIYKSFNEHKQVTFRGVKLLTDGLETALNLVVEPLCASSSEKLAMVTLEPVAAMPVAHGADCHEGNPGDETSRDLLVRQLEEQLRITHEQLQATTDQLETSHQEFMSANEELMSMNEEFQSANEELMSANEELQSTNEELETFREELQLLNEELVTVNAELQGKVEELDQANSDMENLLASSEIATIFLDRHFNVKRFTPAMARIMSLIPADVGRPFRHLAGAIDWSGLAGDRVSVLENKRPVEREVAGIENGRSYIMRVLPYFNPGGGIDGIVVTLVDITERKRAEEALRESEEHVRRKLDSILSPEGEIGNLELADIIDTRTVQSLMNDFYALARIPMSIIDLEGRVLVGVGWQDICTKFHRVHPETCRNCVESDLQLTAGIIQGDFRLYKCKNNMWDAATPIFVGGRHFGNLFMGQFILDEEQLDYETFRLQARRYGFDESEYLAQLEKIPRLGRNMLNIAMDYFKKFAELLSKLSYGNLKLARSLAERDELMESMRESEERFRRAVTDAPYPIMIHAEDGLVLAVNDTWSELSGYGRGDIPTIAAWVGRAHGECAESARSTIERLFESERKHDWGEFVITTAKGEKRTWQFSSAPLGRDSRGKRLVISMASDITDRRSLEEQLRQSQKMEALGQLAGGVAHDFNNILQVIMGYSYMLNRGASQAQKVQLQEIMTASERATELTSGLLSYSRKQVFKMETTDLDQLMGKVEMFLLRILGEDISLSLEHSSTPLNAVVDRAHLQQVFVNLATNARDAMPSGGKLTIRLEKFDMDERFVSAHGFGIPGPYALITVSDTGEGIPGEHLHKIFEPFFTTRGNNKGTGLGLSIVYGIISQLNGFINCRSEKGTGTIFTIFLPLSGSEPAAEEAADHFASRDNQGITILIVEDDPAVRKVTRDILEHCGYVVMEAESGKEALEAFRRHGELIDLVLLDALMPEMNGAETLVRIRQLKPGVKAVFLSGYAREIIGGRMLLPEDVGFIGKPVTPARLMEAIREAIGV